MSISAAQPPARWVVGEVVTLRATLRDESGAPVDPSVVTLLVTDPSGTQTLYNAPNHVGTGIFTQDVTLDSKGIWRYRWETEGVVDATEGTLDVGTIFGDPVTDARDLRVLIPACRRAIDGPQAVASDSPAATLDDQQVLGLLADATAELILQTHGNEAFGYQLMATRRDPFYMAPVAWATDRPRAPAADAAILSQAALDHYFWLIKLLKVTQTIKNEAVSWDYSLSANVIAAWVQYLIANRDKAVQSLISINAPMDAYISLVAERDRLSAAWLEPWVTEVGAPVPYAGGGGSGPLEYDYRFGTWG